MTKLAPEWVRTSDPVISYRWTTAPARPPFSLIGKPLCYHILNLDEPQLEMGIVSSELSLHIISVKECKVFVDNLCAVKRIACKLGEIPSVRALG